MWRPQPELDYEGSIYRPPSEAASIILQVTIGCSHNLCTFCESYKDKKYRLKDFAVVERDIETAALLYPRVTKLFVADGDALVMPMVRWRRLLALVREKLPSVERVGVYATARSIRKKSDEDLRWLRENGMGIIYLGIESGDAETLRYIRKDSTPEEVVEAGRRVKAAGIALSVTVLLGIAPGDAGFRHAENTGKLLSLIDPDFVGVLSVMVCEGTELYDMVRAGSHKVPDARGYLAELRVLLENTELTQGFFMSNHASNHLPLRIRMPGEKAGALRLLSDALEDKVGLRPESRRFL